MICVDGPSGAGKGTLARRLANRLGFHYLDSGALYRILGVLAGRQQIDLADEQKLADLARSLKVVFHDDQVLYQGQNLSSEIRLETAGERASRLAALPAVREALVECQRNFAQLPGLVADGRDMGSRIFLNANLKIFLTASAEQRAFRRLEQLRELAIAAPRKGAKRLIHKEDGDSLRALAKEIEIRDQRDMNRTSSPLCPAADSIEVDSTSLSVDEVLGEVLSLWNLEVNSEARKAGE